MVEKKITINNETGIHARPASLIVQKANEFGANIFIAKAGQEVNAKSIMGIMSLGISKSTEITIKAEGADEAVAVDGLIDLIQNRFGE